MISKKCPKCRGKVKREYDFCPYCSYNLKKENEGKNWGFLGRDDTSPDFNKFSEKMGSSGGFGRLLNNLMMQFDKELRELDKQMGEDKRHNRKEGKPKGLSINISTGTGKNPKIKVKRRGPNPRKEDYSEEEMESKEVKHPKLSKNKAKKISGMPREEAETNVRRMSDNLIYEIKLPGVKSIGDIGISKLENSIEIKAISDDKVYVKLIPLSALIKDYKLKNGKLILELESEN